jgi:Tfp pilus assembly protein PilF
VASSTTPPPVHVPRALGTYQQRDAEEEERERGNTEFKNGNFTAAVKSYTKCLGLKGKNYVAFSNRAMAYLKLKEYARAVVGIICKCICDFFGSFTCLFCASANTSAYTYANFYW